MFIVGILALLLGIIFKLNKPERLAVLILIGLVMSLEMVNTAIEAVVDLVSPEKHPLAKVAKDCASGAVGIMSIFAAIIGLSIFIPKIIALF